MCRAIQWCSLSSQSASTMLIAVSCSSSAYGHRTQLDVADGCIKFISDFHCAFNLKSKFVCIIMVDRIADLYRYC